MAETGILVVVEVFLCVDVRYFYLSFFFLHCNEVSGSEIRSCPTNWEKKMKRFGVVFIWRTYG